MPDLLSFGAWLKQRRRTLDLTQAELAQRAACSLSTLRKLEADDLQPSKELAQLLSVALAIPATEHDAFIAFARGSKTTFLLQADVVTPATPATMPLAASPKRSVASYSLPEPLTGLVGCERELQSGGALLRRPHVRLMTLVGPPGAGKTRLSLALAKALRADFAHGACFVPLAPISDPALVPSAIAQALHIHERAEQSLLTTLQDALHNQHLLLVLDNFEQVVAAAPLVSELLLGAPDLKIIASSREPLKLYGEFEFPVAPLAVPDIHHLPAADLLEMYPAVELFTQRAQAVRPTFAVDAENAAAIAHICAWLDGLPLAIEMAAARIKWQSPALLLAQLRQQLMALTGGPRDLTPRQQTLRGAMDWSYNLLTPVEQQLFVALGVFNDGATATSIAAITELAPATCEALLQGLAEKSLLQYSADETGELRYTLLQMVREYAQMKQLEQGAQSTFQRRHAAFYRDLVQASLAQIKTANAEAVLQRLTLEHNNLRNALGWCLEADWNGGLHLATMLANTLWDIRGHYSEGRNWLEKFLAFTAAAASAETAAVAVLSSHAAAWFAVARLALGQGDIPAAATFATRSEGFALRAEEDAAVRAALRCRAAIALHQSDYSQATRLYQQALDLCQLPTDQQEAATILNGLGLIAKDQGDYSRALTLHDRSLAFYTTVGDKIGMARSLTYASIALFWQGDYGRCIEIAQQAMTLQSGIGDVTSVSYSREMVAVALVKLGRFAEGIHALEECLVAFQTLEDRSGEAVVLVDLGQAFYEQQNYARSLGYHQAALRLAYTIGDRRRCAFALEGTAMALTQLPAVHGSHEIAVRLFSAAAALRTAIHAPLPTIERTLYEAALARATTQLSSTQYQAAWADGCAWSLEQAVREADGWQMMTR